MKLNWQPFRAFRATGIFLANKVAGRKIKGFTGGFRPLALEADKEILRNTGD